MKALFVEIKEKFPFQQEWVGKQSALLQTVAST